MSQESKKKLRLTVEIDGIWADDLDECAATIAEFRDGPPTAEDRLFIVTEEWMRPEVVVTICTIPGPKCMNDDFTMETYQARVVGAEAVERAAT